MEKIVKSQSIHNNLPAELWSEILSRLPVISLLRFRCVSKSWRSMIEDPNFCRSHLNNFKNNSLETHLLVVRISAREHVCAIYCNKTFTNSVVLDPLQPCNGPTKNHSNSKNWHIVCSLDGLVLLTLYTPTLKLTLWNPSIRRSRVLHVSRTRSESVKYFELGFGFNPIIKDYKHVRFVKCGESNLHSIELYTVGSGTWRTIQYQDAGGSKWRWNFCDSYRWKRLCFRGILYFTPSRINSGVQELVSFNLNSEMFDSTSFPMDDDDPFRHLTPLLHDGGCSLGLAVVSFAGGSIWVLESSGGDINSMYWTKHYTFALNTGYWNHFLYIKKDGELLIQRPKIVTSYDLETHEEKTLVNDHEFGVSMSHAYTESLLLLHG